MLEDRTTWRRNPEILILHLSDVLHPNRANVSKDELRSKLAELYKANKDQVSCFGFRTQYGGGKSTGFALIYSSQEAMKKFEPHYRLVRYGMANKIEKASRQQREFTMHTLHSQDLNASILIISLHNRKTEKESGKDCARNGQEQGRIERQEEIEQRWDLALWYKSIEFNLKQLDNCTFRSFKLSNDWSNIYYVLCYMGGVAVNTKD